MLAGKAFDLFKNTAFGPMLFLSRGSAIYRIARLTAIIYGAVRGDDAGPLTGGTSEGVETEFTTFRQR